MSSALSGAKLGASFGANANLGAAGPSSLEALAAKGGVAGDKTANKEAAEAAKQFEQLMLFELLKAMRATIPNSGDGAEGFSRDTFDGMLDQALSETMAGHLGLTSLLEQQLGANGQAAEAPSRTLTRRAPVQTPLATPAPSHTHAHGVHSHAFEQSTQPGFAHPVEGRESSAYGWRQHPISGERKFHAGVDIAAPEGTEIRAVQSGTVTFAGKKGGYGNVVELRHEDGTTTSYAHASRLHVRAGDRIEVGEAIADVGSTGYSTGPHLHFEVRRNGRTLDPNAYLNDLARGSTESSQPAVSPEREHKAKPRAGVTNFSLARFVKAYEADPEGE